MENNTSRYTVYRIRCYRPGGSYKKRKKHITRNAKWNDLCRYWTTKSGNACVTYFDIDANDYRTCSGNYKIRFI